ncbi:nitrate reductase molybdenum cofactor assembly chaperone [Nonomuraea sp. NPDC004186]
MLDAVTGAGADADDPDNVFHAVTDLRIPLEYLASLFSAGDTEVVAGVLMKLSAMRAYMRARTVDGTVATDLLDAVGMTAADMERMYRLLAIAKYDERYVVPTAHREDAAALAAQADGCSLDGDGGPGMGEFHPTGHPRQALEQFLWWFRDRRPMGLARHYVETFDLRRKSSLYLTYYLHGDTRRRGMALLTLKQRYRLAGLTPPEGELPDFLPVFCEFAALAGPAAGEAPLRRHRKGLELIRTALHDSGSPYALVLDAPCAMLPGLSAAERSAVADLALAGPPVEEVGLAPFGPPLNEMEARP